tara:strand:- start:42887 stop:43333 length:447 start_codon:yes stop_codon:yes gene_type:complete
MGCNQQEKEKSNFEDDSSSMSNILNMIRSVFNSNISSVQSVPPPLLLIGKNLRPGMSARNLTGRILSRMESDSNIPSSDIFLDGTNNEAKKVRVMSEEIVKMVQTEAKVDIVVDPGSIQVLSTGSAGPIPVVVQGSNINLVSGGGGVQ